MKLKIGSREEITHRSNVRCADSNYGPTLLMKCQEHLGKRGVPLASNQIAYSLIGRHNGSQETVDKCQELGIQVLAYYPFAMVRMRTVYVFSHHPTSLLELSDIFI